MAEHGLYPIQGRDAGYNDAYFDGSAVGNPLDFLAIQIHFCEMLH